MNRLSDAELGAAALHKALTLVEKLRAENAKANARIATLDDEIADALIENAVLREKLEQYPQVKYARNHWADQANQLKALLREARETLRYYSEVYPEPRGEEVYTRRAREACLRIDVALGEGEKE